MARQNVTHMLGFTSWDFLGLRNGRLAFFLAIYLLTLLGNLVILLTISLSPQRHSPMYHFLSKLSLLDMCHSSVMLPRMLADFLAGSCFISFGCCEAQQYSFHFFGDTECFLLMVLTYNQYVATCDPLHYARTMNQRVCVWLVTGTCLAGSPHSALQISLTFRLPYCRPNQLDHYFCDVPPLLKLACADTSLNEAVLLLMLGRDGGPQLLDSILGSYIRIVTAVFWMHSE